MQMTVHGKRASLITKNKWRMLLFLVSFFFFSPLFSQTITLSLQKTSLEKAFREIEARVPQRFVYTNEMLEGSKPVNINVREASLQRVLSLIFAEQPLTYSIDEDFIKVRFKTSPTETATSSSVRGKVVDEKGRPLQGVTVTALSSRKSTATDNTGQFALEGVGPNEQLLATSIGFLEKEIAIKGRSFIEIELRIAYSSLDETVVVAYGTTTKRLNTGSISKVSAEEIARQPVSNPLNALQGRVPGLVVSQTNGYANGSVNIQLRGQNSIAQNSQPFFIIDGVPFAAQNNTINLVSNASLSGVSPFSTINPSEIESIEILKDADATAIYGSRGANGVVLITTKKGKAGKTKVDAHVWNGWSRVTRTMDMLNTEQYVAMRKEAYTNDGITPTANNAADILLWDTHRYTDIKKLFLGGTAHAVDANVSLSGGSANTQFLINGGYHRENTVLPTALADYRLSLHSSLSHSSPDKRFTVSLLSGYSYTKNVLPGVEATQFINRAPNIKLYDEAGKLNWEEKGVSFYNSTNGATFSNPLASLNRKYTGNFQNLTNALTISYRLLPYLHLKTNVGYNVITSDEVRIHPTSSLDPFDISNFRPSAFFGNNNNKNWIAEPQVELVRNTSFGKLNVLIGGTWQKQNTNGITVTGSNYQSDLLLGSISGAGNISANNIISEYRYNAIFGRINYNWEDEYIVNLTARRDGSSRFGPNTQFNDFGAVGVAWIFSNAGNLKQKIPWLSFGKVRSSYGTTGNDGIGNYRFLDTWTSSSTTYQGVPALDPTGLFNPELAWEINKKFDAAIELGFFDQRIQLSVDYFRNRSGNQLVNYNLPIQTGFSSILKNREALVQNEGYELSLETRNINSTRFSWTSSLNVTLARNKLLEFPGLSSSSYANQLVIGQPLSVMMLLHSLGVDAASGVYKQADVDNSGSFNAADKTILKNVQPRFYGGVQNELHLGGFEVSFFLQFVKQQGRNYLATISGNVPGAPYLNQPVTVLNRWQKPGDKTDIQKFTTTAGTGFINLALSDAVFSDASFIRFKNAVVAYSLPSKLLQRIKLQNLRLYISGQNIFTFTKYVGADPENQSMYVMPPLKTVAGGIQLTF